MKKTISFAIVLFLSLTVCFKAYAAEYETVMFVSDVHTFDENLSGVIDAAENAGNKPELICFAGDYGNTFTIDELTVRGIRLAVGDIPATFTKGNHEGDTPDEYFNEFTGSKRIGKVAENENYIVINFGTKTRERAFDIGDVAYLSELLQEAPSNKTVFVVSHYPLHCNCEERLVTNALPVIELLNGYPNCVFVWGHNHTVEDEMYGTVYTNGNELQYGIDEAEKKAINFTYLSAGCLGKSSQVDNNSAMTAKIGKDSISISYYALDYCLNTLTLNITKNADGVITGTTKGDYKTASVFAQPYIKMSLICGAVGMALGVASGVLVMRGKRKGAEK